MKLGFKAFLVVFSLSLIIVISCAVSLFQYQEKRIAQQSSLVEKSLHQSLQGNPTLTPLEKQQTIQHIKQRLAKGANQNLKIVTLLLIFSILITAAIAYLFFLNITGKLAKMLETTKAIERGNYNEKLSFRSNDELQHLAEAINHMSVTIAEREIELKRNYNELQERESYLKNLIDTVKAGIVLIDAETRCIVDANSAIAEMTGCKVEQMIGQKCCQFFCEATDGDCPIIDLGEELDNSEKNLIKADGKLIPILKTATFIQINGRPHILENMLDLSQLKQAEQENKQLEEQLLQAQKMDTIGRLAGGIAHDFNNLLSGVLGYAELARTKAGDNEQLQKYLAMISDAGSKASSITRQLLVFSRKDPVQKEPIDLNELITKMLGLLQKLLGEKMELQLQLAAEQPCISGDKGQLEQVLMNLAVNARDAMPNGGKLTFSTETVSVDRDFSLAHEKMPPGDYIRLRAQDNGCGISAEVLPNIFEPFFTTKPKDRGTGLGLSTVYGIIKQHDSYIFVSSNIGEGTVFSIYFPVSSDHSTAVPTAEEVKTSIDGHNKSIFVIDDEVLVRNMAADTLLNLGFDVSEFGSAEAVMEHYQQTGICPDILLTDVILPGMSGIDLLRHTQTIKCEMKTIVMTGYTDKMESIRKLLAEGTIFIEKPLTPSKLISALNQSLQTPD